MKSKIKTQLAMGIITILSATQVHAQGAYINLGAGYGLSAASIWPATESTNNYNSVTGTSTSEAKIIWGSGSLGKGVQMGGTFGYMFTENIGAELGIGYLIGAKIRSTYTSNSSTSTSEDVYTISGNMLRVIPALRITAGNGKVKPYMRMGLVIGLGAKMKETSTYKFIDTWGGNTTTYTTETEVEYSGRTSIGFAGGIGADFKASDNFGIFAEIGIITQSWAPKKSVYTKYTVDGVDQLPSMTTSQKEREYVNSYSETSSSNPNTSSPSKTLKQYAPFSSIGLNLGLYLSF